MELKTLIPVCPICSHAEYLEVGYFFHAQTGVLVRTLWSCSKVNPDFAGCGWSGAEPRKTLIKVFPKPQELKGISVEEFTSDQKKLYESGDLVLVLNEDGTKEVII